MVAEGKLSPPRIIEFCYLNLTYGKEHLYRSSEMRRCFLIKENLLVIIIRRKSNLIVLILIFFVASRRRMQLAKPRKKWFIYQTGEANAYKILDF